MKTVLFLCTGNYYRSRFAEIYFSWHARQRGLAYVADSRGLALEPANPGPMSRNSIRWLRQLEIPVPQDLPFPRQVQVEDLERASLIVAVKEAEHRPLLTRNFPEWADRVEYWQIDDIDCDTPDRVLPVLERQVAALLDRLTSQTGDAQPIGASPRK